MKLISIPLLFGLALLAACSVDAPTDAPASPVLKTARTISWEIAGTNYTVIENGRPVPCTGGHYINRCAVAAGQTVSHLGLITGGGDACVKITSGNPQLLQDVQGEIRAEYVELVAANGDVLNLRLDGTFWSVDETEDRDALTDYVMNHAGTYTFEGGTGRFADASGDGEYTAVHLWSDRSIVFQLDGTLEY